MTFVNPAGIDPQAFTAVRFGFRVDRATAALPASVAADIFLVTTGRVALLAVVGQVTTIIQAQANNTKLIAHPTTGSDVDICATADITGLEVGGKLGITGTFATALQKALAGAIVLPTNPVVLDPGSLRLSCSATNTGSVKWTVWYLPLDDGASMAAA